MCIRDRDMDSYETLYIGFPIWYWAAPNIINTFIKQYDLSGKKIVLFATSGGSNIGKTAEKLKPYLSAGAEIAGAEAVSYTHLDVYKRQPVSSLAY